MIEKSVFTNPDPKRRRGSRFRALPAAGCEKHAVLNHSDSVGMAQHRIAGLIGADQAIPVGVQQTRARPLLLSTTKTGKPDVAFSITVSFPAPEDARCAAPFQLLPHLRPLPNGRS